MELTTAVSLLRTKGFRDTQPRRLVLKVLHRLRRATTPAEIEECVRAEGDTINLVTVYRVLEVLLELGIAHRHPCSGKVALCTLPSADGHHGFLHCSRCGDTEEFMSPELCAVEDRIARSAGFKAKDHVSEIVGTCRSCV
jgi:Fur family ferric uptake transcriptional regulator